MAFGRTAPHGTVDKLKARQAYLERMASKPAQPRYCTAQRSWNTGPAACMAQLDNSGSCPNNHRHI